MSGQALFDRVFEGLGFRSSVTIEPDGDGGEREVLGLHLPRWVRWCPPVRWFVCGPFFDAIVRDMRARPETWA